ncbi:MAG TPA: DNA-binding protein [Desulfotomaculum sp.]|nr:DNA-binding protein [Desulfotomaculum sp.]HBY03045.1 DNA-binding protein [Desulfotomaculum sp.]
MAPIEKLYSPEEAALVLGVNIRTITKWLREGKLTGSKLGKVWRIEEQALKDFINANKI